MLISVGLQDDAYPVRICIESYNYVRVQKEYRIYQFAGHGVGNEHNKIKEVDGRRT